MNNTHIISYNIDKNDYLYYGSIPQKFANKLLEDNIKQVKNIKDVIFFLRELKVFKYSGSEHNYTHLCSAIEQGDNVYAFVLKNGFLNYKKARPYKMMNVRENDEYLFEAMAEPIDDYTFIYLNVSKKMNGFI